MNRVIKFRYRYTNGTNWIFQVFTLAEICNGMPFEVLSDNPLLKNYRYDGEDQFSGLTDKHGVEVYEGDIVKCSIGCQHIVEFIPEVPNTNPIGGGMPGFYLSGLNQGYSWTGDEEVIGNVFEHPELIK